MTSPASETGKRVAHCSDCGREWEPTAEEPCCHVLNPGDHSTTLLCKTCSAIRWAVALGLSRTLHITKVEGI